MHGGGWQVSPIESLLSVLGWLARAYPEVADWLQELANGDAKAVAQVNSIIPPGGASGAAKRWMKDDQS